MTQRQLPGVAFAKTLGSQQRQVPGGAFVKAGAVGPAPITGGSSIALGEIASAAAGSVISGITGASSIALDAIGSAAAGTVTGFGAVTGASSVALGAIGSAATAAVGATLTIGPFKNKSGTVLVSASVAHLVAMSRATRAVVLSQASLTTNASGLLVLRDSNFVPGADYMVATWSVDGASAGNARVTAAA